MKKLLLYLLIIPALTFGQVNKKHIYFMLNNQANSADPNIALGNTFLTTNAKSRAYWDFTTQLTGVEDAAITSISDLSPNSWTLENFAGAATPVEGKLQVELQEIKTLAAYTSAGYEKGLVGNSASTNLLKNSLEVFLLINLIDGQTGGTQWLFGVSNGGTQNFRIGINATGNIEVQYAAAGATNSVLTSSGNALINGLTGMTLIRVIFDFTADVISGYVNGVPVSFTLNSGNALSVWNPANWTCSKGIGIGGHWDGVFTNDTGNKHILKIAVTDILTNDEYIQLAASFLNY